ncbi:MAG: tetratricopeptide repeat protein [Elusimicrobiota bacterium]
MEMTLRKNYWWMIPALIAGILYFNSLKGSFFWDDKQQILENYTAKSFSKAFSAFAPYFWNNETTSTKGQYRPLRNITFAFDYGVWGANPYGYHLTNYMLNILAVYLFCVLSRELSASSRTALFSGMLFSAYPMHVESVTYIKNRSDVICMVFILLAFIMFIKERHGWALLAYALALISKEMALVFPAAAVLYLIYRKRSGEILGKTWPYFALAAGFALFKIFFLRSQTGEIFSGIPGVSQPMLALSTLCNYIQISLLPLVFNIERELQTISSLPGWQLLVTGLASALVLFAAIRSKNREMNLFFIAWFILFLVPVMNILPIAGRLIAEQRLYIPSAGLCLLGGSLADEFYSSGAAGQRMAAALLIGITMLFSVKVIQRNELWKDELLLWDRTAARNPTNTRVLNNLANVLMERGNYEASERIFRNVVSLAPDDAAAYGNIGILKQKKGDIDGAMSDFEKAAALDPGDDRNFANLASAHLMKGDKEKAMEYYGKALKIKPASAAVYTNMGIIYAMDKRYNEAAESFKQAVRLNPDMIEARLNLAQVYKELGLASEAKRELKEAQLRSTNTGLRGYNPRVELRDRQ